MSDYSASTGAIERAEVARVATRRAGDLTWELFHRGVETDLKADRTPVTIADKQAEELLREAIRKAFPGDGFLGEEYGEEPSSTGYRWIIDPIDATANFVRGIPIFGTLVGLEHEGRMVAGFVHHPGLGNFYHAVKGGGAFKNDRPIRVSTVERYDDALLIYSSLRFFDKAGTTPQFLQFEKRFPRTRGFGDFFGFLLIAEGAAEIMIDPVTSPWDVAALQPIVEEAGGVFMDWSGKPTSFGDGSVAANPAFAREFLSCAKRAG
ncbi:MAG TPA: inositol monophosphatase family protein [Planctomycetia bacterium]|nr:inositol monophosphatase family protein [Planctomycetia bacterium]